MPQLISALPVLACPLGMGAMMLVMSRMHRPTEQDRSAKLARLQAEIDALRHERAEYHVADAAEGTKS